MPGGPIGNRIHVQLSSPMRTGQHPQCAIVGRTIIQMQADGNHVSENVRRRLHVNNARFDRPRTKPRCLNALSHRNSQVLMPRHPPVRGVGLVEENRPHRKSLFPDQSADEGNKLVRSGDRSGPGTDPKNIPQPTPRSRCNFLLGSKPRTEFGRQGIAFHPRQQFGNNQKTIAFKLTALAHRITGYFSPSTSCMS